MKRSIAVLGIVACTGTAYADVVDVDNAALARLMAAGVPVIDIRTAPEWQQSGVLPGSHPLTFFDEHGRSNPADWIAKARAIAKPDRPVILICRSGNRTRLVSDFLSQRAGYAKVYNVREGVLAWIRDGRPMVPAEPVVAACRKTRTC